ncbi:RpnC/YadD family protein [Streptomyces beihaiensis]|uniref:DUF4365 domain-containing protein n=1 Tax=Streptomyces beihaiensis TaxID=2984495 RepID=A0ABT3TUZ0_9ACTN|nr:hypothetical protein [Streptomyces beihaiensis]MCX3060845.1 hypothetical protein [Streptomyces beihaiensis]
MSETGVKFPDHSAIEPLDTDLTEIRPLERRVDSFFRVRTVDDEGGFLLAVESQSQPDPDKHNSWTYYLAHMYAKYRLPPILVVVCRDKKTAAWAERPIHVGRSFHTSMKVYPLVLGPIGLRPVTDPDEAAKDPARTTFSVLVNAKDPGILAILDAVAPVLGPNADWAEFIEAGLDDGPARDHWRELMAVYTPNFPGFGSVMEEAWIKVHSDGEEKGKAQGKAEGKAEDILRVLDVRGIEVSESVRDRVMDCADLELLATWFDRSLAVETAEELFAEDD